MSKVQVVIPTMRVGNYLDGCINSLVSFENDMELMVVDNSTDNIGVAAAWNLGCEKAVDDKLDYILILNDDILLSKWTVDSLVTAFKTDVYSEQPLMLASGWHTGTADTILDWPQPSSEIREELGPAFSCFMISVETYKKIGSFDEKFYPAYFEDNDYHRRINLAGGRGVCIINAPFFHYGSKTQSSVPSGVVKSEQFNKNREYYAKKWGGVVGAEIYSEPWDGNPNNMI